MDIYILRDGQETGPFTEEAARALLTGGTVADGDFAWCPGMPDWKPLSEILPPEPAPRLPEKKEPTRSAGPRDSATPAQRAFLDFVGIALPADLPPGTVGRAINDVMQSPDHRERAAQWNEARLRLHPDLFAAEIHAKKENRAGHFFQLCETVGACYFHGLTKAHCQVLVGFLDVKFPHWDARGDDAAPHYFFPAVAEKFPQLVHKQWRGRLHYAEGAKTRVAAPNKPPASPSRKKATSPLAAITRGIVLGLLILAGLYLAHRIMENRPLAAPEPAPAAGAENQRADWGSRISVRTRPSTFGSGTPSNSATVGATSRFETRSNFDPALMP